MNHGIPPLQPNMAVERSIGYSNRSTAELGELRWLASCPGIPAPVSPNPAQPKNVPQCPQKSQHLKNLPFMVSSSNHPTSFRP